MHIKRLIVIEDKILKENLRPSDPNVFFLGNENTLTDHWSIIHCFKASYSKFCVPPFSEDRSYILITKKNI